MAIRWRISGELVCAAMSDPQENDTYIDDRLHHQLLQHSGAIIADIDHEENGLWHWVHNMKYDGCGSIHLRAVDEMKVLEKRKMKE